MTPTHSGGKRYTPKRLARLAAVAATTTIVVGAGSPPGPATRPATADVVVDPETAGVLDGATRWLAAHQQPNGAWAERQHQVAVTGYVLMAMLATGNLPGQGPHGDAVDRGVGFLLANARSDGYLVAADEQADDKGMYGHGVATIALAEVYGQTRDAKLRPKLARAVKLIVDTQNARGGWRYFPRVADDDLSVSVLQIVALRAAKNDGLDVPRATLDRAVSYVRLCADRRGTGGFAYQPGGGPGFARTAAAVYALQVCGLYDDPMVKAGLAYLDTKRGKAVEWFTYGNFYAAPARYMTGGDQWPAWYADMRQTLLGRVVRDGDSAHWPVLEKDASGNNDVYVTAVDTLILAMPYQYVPLYQR